MASTTSGMGQADIFAFEMLAVEGFTEKLPFGDVGHEAGVLTIGRGRRLNLKVLKPAVLFARPSAVVPTNAH